ncbi:MAG: metallophosphoesterase, partial [Victivallaceae bacterium]|nr:metallophosphoesterase [Victivallaceae bacterium]
MKPWHFIYVADIQPGSPKSFRFNPRFRENWETARKQIIEEKPELMLIGGDITRDGSIHKWELEDMKADLDDMNIPYHVIPGNMDTGNKHADRQGVFFPERDDLSLNITSEQIKQFESVFGSSQWSITHKNLRVSGFCDMLVNSGLPEEEKLWKWLEEQKSLPKSEHHFWLMHYALFIDNPREPNFDITKAGEYYEWYFGIDEPGRGKLLDIFKATGATRVVTGHIHCRKDHFSDGIHFDLAPGTVAPQWGDKWLDGDASLGFYRYDVNGVKMTKTFIPLGKE